MVYVSVFVGPNQNKNRDKDHFKTKHIRDYTRVGSSTRYRVFFKDYKRLCQNKKNFISLNRVSYMIKLHHNVPS